MAKPENTLKVITSWIIFNSVAVYTLLPQRFAGTISKYSKNAMNQLTRITFQSAAPLYRRCPYQANVMKMFEKQRRMIGSHFCWRRVFIGFELECCGCPT